MDGGVIATWVSVGLAAISTAAGTGYYVARLQGRLELASKEVDTKQELGQLRSELDATTKRLHGCTFENKRLRDRLEMAHRVGAAASAQKQRIDDELAELQVLMQASGSSVLIPYRPYSSADVEGLIFASVLPLDEKRLRLRKMLVSLHGSNAGACFLRGKPIVTRDPKTDPDHSKEADRRSGYQPNAILSAPLISQGEVCGVVQFVDRVGTPFDEHDIDLIRAPLENLAKLVYDFARMPGHLHIIGFQSQEKSQQGTILFCDISASSKIFAYTDTASAVEIINDVLSEICDIAFDYNATVDKYLGDGVMLRFNVPRPVSAHEREAVRAAIEMCRTFQAKKAKWPDRVNFTSVHLRIGMASGPVHEALIGHPQYRYLTVLGPPVNLAAALCEEGDRDREVILVDGVIAEKLATEFPFEAISLDGGDKSSRYATQIYRLVVPEEGRS